MLRMMRAPAEATVPLDRAAPGGELDWSCPPESAVHPLLLAVFVALDAVGVRWCVLRGEAELAAPTGDVDLLVANADLDRTRRALAALRFVELPAWGHGSHLFFLSYHRATDRWIELDVVTELAFGRHFALQTRAELSCLAQRRRVGPYYALAPDDAFWTLLL